MKYTETSISELGLKVAFLHPRLEGGGSERVSLATAKRFSSWGIHSTFIAEACFSKEFAMPEDLDASTYILPYPGGFHSPDNRDNLVEYITNEGIQIVFTCYLQSHSVADMIAQLKGTCKWVYWLHSKAFWEIIHDKECLRNEAKYSLKRWIRWNLLGKKRYYHSEAFKESIYSEYRRNVDLYDKFITLSEYDIVSISHQLQLSEQEQTKLLQLTNTIKIEEDVQLNKDKTIIWVGRLEFSLKRVDRMLRIWALSEKQLPDWTLKFYGASHDHHIFEKMVKRYGLKRAIYAGYTPDLKQIYDKSSILCSTSTFEGFPMVLLEAQNNGVIPMSFDSYPTAEKIIKDNEHDAGVLVQAFDLKSYAEKLVSLCNDEAKLKAMQQNCLKKRYDYAPDINDEKWMAFFEELLS